jgi:hypothetical protein
MKWILIVLVFVGVAGCAVAPARYLNASLSDKAPGTSAVSIERHKKFGYDALPVIIYVDGKSAAQIHGGQVVTLYIKDGRHSIGVSAGQYAAPEREIAIDVSPENKPILRAHSVALGYGGWGIDLVTR